VHAAREAVLQTAEVVFAIAQEVLRSARMGMRCLEQAVLANVPGAVLFVEDEVPERVSMASDVADSTYHRWVKWMARLSTMGPERLMLMSDQPMRELLVRSTVWPVRS
jgi:hypothetical protein